MSQEPNDILQELAAACDGLLFPSETDASLEPFAGANITAPANADAIPADAIPLDTSLEEFFAPATTEEEWMNEDECATARRFQVLVGLLQSRLNEVHLFRTSGIPADIYIVGQHQGQVIGIKTRVVET